MATLIAPDGVVERLAIARLEERRQAVATAEIANESEELAGGTLCYVGPGSWANQAAGLGLDGPVSDAELDRFVAFYESRGTEPRIEVASVADESLHAGLAARGFVIREWEHVLVRPLDESVTALLDPAATTEGLTIERVDASDDAAAEEWVRLSLSGFHPPDEPAPAGSVEATRSTVHHPRTRAFVARVDGAGAGAAGLEVGADVAALFATSVLPAFRRRGIQRALIAARLKEARAAGARLACIHSSPTAGTDRNAMRTGFFLAYPKAALVRPGPGLAASP